MPICPNCSFTPIAQSPFALVLVFPSAHFSLKPTCPNVHRFQNTHLLQSVRLPQLLICPGAHFSWCPFALNAIFPQSSRAKMSIIGAKVLIMLQSAHLPQIPVCPGALVSWCPFSPGAHLPPMPTCPNAHWSQKFSFAQLSAPNTHLPR